MNASLSRTVTICTHPRARWVSASRVHTAREPKATTLPPPHLLQRRCGFGRRAGGGGGRLTQPRLLQLAAPPQRAAFYLHIVCEQAAHVGARGCELECQRASDAAHLDARIVHAARLQRRQQVLWPPHLALPAAQHRKAAVRAGAHGRDGGGGDNLPAAPRRGLRRWGARWVWCGVLQDAGEARTCSSGSSTTSASTSRSSTGRSLASRSLTKSPKLPLYWSRLLVGARIVD